MSSLTEQSALGQQEKLPQFLEDAIQRRVTTRVYSNKNNDVVEYYEYFMQRFVFSALQGKQAITQLKLNVFFH